MSIKVARRRSDKIKRTVSGYEKPEIYLVTGVGSAKEAVTAPGIPSPGSPHPDLSLDMVCESVEADNLPDDLSRWNVNVRYVSEDTKDEDAATRRGSAGTLQESFSFDTGRESKRVTNAITNTPLSKTYARPGEPKRESGGVIGWDGEKAQGVEIPTGAFRFSFQKVFADGELPAGHLGKLAENAYTINNAVWGAWGAKEVLFEGASGRRAIGETIQVTGDDEMQVGRFDLLTPITSETTEGGTLRISISRSIGLVFGASYTIEIFAGERMVGQITGASPGNLNNVSPVGLNGVGGQIHFFKYVVDNSNIQVKYPFPWSINYSFAISPEVASIEAGDITTGVKAGWEYADVVLGPDETTAGGVTAPSVSPEFVYFHELFYAVDFSFLGFIPEF